MYSARLNRTRAALALEMADSAKTPEARKIYLSLWRDWSAIADRADLAALQPR